MSGNTKWGDMRFLDRMNELASYLLMNADKDRQTHCIHPLVHAWARDRASPDQHLQAQTCTTQILALSILDDESVEGYIFRRMLLTHLDLEIITLMPTFPIHTNPSTTEAGRWKETEELQSLILEVRRQEPQFTIKAVLRLQRQRNWRPWKPGKQCWQTTTQVLWLRW
jgi:hypothetical protein